MNFAAGKSFSAITCSSRCCIMHALVDASHVKLQQLVWQASPWLCVCAMLALCTSFC